MDEDEELFVLENAEEEQKYHRPDTDIAPRCPCGTMMVLSVGQEGMDNDGFECVLCDGVNCDAVLSPKDNLFTCPNGADAAHLEGFDLCIVCAAKKD